MSRQLIMAIANTTVHLNKDSDKVQVLAYLSVNITNENYAGSPTILNKTNFPNKKNLSEYPRHIFAIQLSVSKILLRADVAI